ncbi:hypothetical protein HTZ77_18425 [Nonomuraea sp. SMC257]|uniref:Uncharacterized protein n=1 Tax=Nonomuraea montanisoli TaxID=2741721 RepID=A0A7Y6I7Y7_9ACTN|nr:hypothetical protein [Nonomuraea montanisoli]NUW33390.1 hypothetical protein [Nonomuraea montanisoli]
MRLKMISTLLAVYAITAAPEFLRDEWRIIVQPATDDAVEVYYQPVSPVMLRSYEGIGPFLRGLEAAERRARTYPYDLAPPYVLHEPYRLVAPYVTARGRELAAPPISGVNRSDGKSVPYTIFPRVRPAENSQAALTALMQDGAGAIDEPEVFGMGIEPELNRASSRRTSWTRTSAADCPRVMGGSSPSSGTPSPNPLASCSAQGLRKT